MVVIPRSTGSFYVEFLKHLAPYMCGDTTHSPLYLYPDVNQTSWHHNPEGMLVSWQDQT